MTPPPRNPIGQAIAAVIALLAVAGAFLFGIVALGFILGFALILGGVMWVRTWWLTRTGKISQPRDPFRPQQQAERNVDALEAEYEVVSKEQDQS